MDSNAFLLSFGMKPGYFDRTEGPIESDDGFVYEAWEARKSPKCPRCGSSACVIHNRYTAEIRHRSDILKSEILVCHRIRYCLSLDSGLANAYDCLQGLCRYMRVEDTFTKCLENVRFVARKLKTADAKCCQKSRRRTGNGRRRSPGGWRRTSSGSC